VKKKAVELLIRSGVYCVVSVGPYDCDKKQYFVNFTFPDSEIWPGTLHTTHGKIRFFSSLGDIAEFLSEIGVSNFNVCR